MGILKDFLYFCFHGMSYKEYQEKSEDNFQDNFAKIFKEAEKRINVYVQVTLIDSDVVTKRTLGHSVKTSVTLRKGLNFTNNTEHTLKRLHKKFMEEGIVIDGTLYASSIIETIKILEIKSVEETEDETTVT